MADRTGLDGTMLHYLASTESFGESKQTRTFENHTTLLSYLANWLLYTPENGFQGAIKRQGGLLKFSLHLLFEQLPERAPTKT